MPELGDCTDLLPFETFDRGDNLFFFLLEHLLLAPMLYNYVSDFLQVSVDCWAGLCCVGFNAFAWAVIMGHFPSWIVFLGFLQVLDLLNCLVQMLGCIAGQLQIVFSVSGLLSSVQFGCSRLCSLCSV